MPYAIFKPILSRLSNASVSAPQLLFAVALFILLTANSAFFSALYEYYPLEQNLGFIFVVGLVMLTVIIVLELLFSLLIPVKWVAGFFLLISAVCAYFSDNMGVIFSVDMIQNSVQTNPAEAMDLITWGTFLHVLIWGILPIALIGKLPVSFSAAGLMNLPQTLRTLSWIVISLMIAATGIWTVSSQFASFIREHKSVRYFATPVMPLHSAIKYALSEWSDNDESFQSIATFAATPTMPGHRELVVMVVGETARADHFSINGYDRQTTPRLAAMDRVISYSDVSACGTSTAISVPCMFARAGQKDYDGKEAKHTENLLDVIHKAGVSVLWRDNNSDSKGVATRITYENFRDATINPECDVECRDIGMLFGLQEYVDSQSGDILIVLHQMGSHGPAYYKRYPPEFERFTPACQSAELSNCDQQSIINAYDNTIYYTDYFLSKVIEWLQQNSNDFETTMVYVSDHGESLGENGLFLHGMPYLFAPQAQTKVPVVVWAGPRSDVDYDATVKLKDQSYSHDDVFPSLLKLFEIESDAYPPETPGLLEMLDETP